MSDWIQEEIDCKQTANRNPETAQINKGNKVNLAF